MSENENTPKQENQEGVSRLSLAKKIAYVVPVAYAVIAASERPALASSLE
jgi:hypothetical protein